MKKLISAAAFALMLPAKCLSPFAYGQAVSTNGGSIQGLITDPTGAAVPGATVTIVAPSTGYSKVLTTDQAGYYTLGPLLPGGYVITVDAPSFRTLKVNTVVQTGTVTSGSQKLVVGSQSEIVEVDAGAVQVNTDQIGVSGVVTQEQIDTLPVNGRNILDIAQIQPGVILQQGQSFDPTKAGYSAISVSGVSGRTTRILLDGQDITDETVGTTIFNVPSGPIDELQLNRSTQDVSGEVTSTGQVLVTTHAGTNKVHGNAFYNFQDYRVGFADASPLTGISAPFQRNQFGGYVGGPIIPDKLFFFGGAERIKQDQQDGSNGDPTFSSLYQQYPLVAAPFRDTYSTARLDYNGPHAIRFFVRGAYSVNSDAATFGFTPYSVYNNRDNVPAIVGGADFTSGKLTHSFRVGYEKFHNILGDETAALGTSIYNPSNILGFPIALNGTQFSGDNFNAGPNFLAPQQTYQSDKQFRYDGTWTVGSHTIKFGYNQNRILNGGFAEFFGAALFTDFSSAVSNLAPGCAPGQLPCSADPLNGYVAAAYFIGNGNSLFSERPGFGLTGGGDPSWRFGTYVGDTWKVTPSFTLSAGVRWSVDTDRANQDLPTPLCSSVTASYNPGCSGNTPLFDQYQLGLGKQTHQPYGDFGPQLGFVFSPGQQKTSLRGGIGIYYDSSIFNNTGNARTEVIQANGAYQNQGVLSQGASLVNLPGLGPVSYFNPTSGAPCATAAAGCVSVNAVSQESIAQAAPQINALKTYYQGKVQGSTGPNPAYIGTGDGLYADNIYAAPYVVPYSIQFNGGIQQEIHRGLIFSADYVHNATLKLPLSIDVNHDGAASTLNVTAARNAITNTVAAFPTCPQGSSAASINCAIANGAAITDFASNGLDSGASFLGGTSAGANGLTPNTGAAFAGNNPNVGEGLFILPVGRSGYDALQLVLQQQSSHPLPGIVRSNLQISYSLSRVVSTNAAGNSADQSFEGAHSFNNNNPTEFIGRNNLDHLNELNMGGSLSVKYGVQVGFIGHFYSSPATTLTLDNLSGQTGAIFTSDTFGDGGPSNSGVAGGLAPGNNPGSYMRSIKPGNLNQYIRNYNASYANTATPAGQALINAGLMTLGQLQALGGVQQPLATAPASPLSNAAFRSFDFSASYPIPLARLREGVSLVPGVAMYNVFNMSNFTALQGVLLNQADAGTPGFVNGPADQTTLNSNRVLRGAGTFDQGGPRTTEFQLKLNF